MKDRIKLVGLDVHSDYLKSGKYLVASCKNEESSFYTPHLWVFRLEKCLQIINGTLTDNGVPFGALADGVHWNIYWKQESRDGVHAFSDIWLVDIRKESQNGD